MIVLDIVAESMVGHAPQAIVRPGARRLNSKHQESLRNNIRILKELLTRHRLTEKLIEAHKHNEESPKLFKQKVEKVDQQSKEFMIRAEKKCRKIRCGRIPFSPEASMWLKRTQFYRTLLWFWGGKKINRGNLKQLARRPKIANAFSVTKEEIAMKLRECKEQCMYFQVHGQRYHTKHLNSRLEAARAKGDEEAEKCIIQIIAREHDRAFWRRLNWSLEKRRGASVASVQVKTSS
jgi:hypothetical protein